jgi:hypothetical protein
LAAHSFLYRRCPSFGSSPESRQASDAERADADGDAAMRDYAAQRSRDEDALQRQAPNLQSLRCGRRRW